MPNKLAALLAGAIATLSGGAGSSALPELPPAPAGQAVSELLMMDARRALAAEHARHMPQAQAPAAGLPHARETPYASPPAVAARPAPLLASIYGVGNRLHAQVVIDGRQALFASGQARSIGGEPTPWRLKRIAPPCVDLESEKNGVMRLCTAKTEEKR